MAKGCRFKALKWQSLLHDDDRPNAGELAAGDMGPGVSTPSERAWPVHMYGSIGQRVGLWWSRKEERNNKKEDAGVFSQNMPKKQFRSIQDELKGKTKIQRYKTVVFYNFTQHDKKTPTA